MFIAIDCTSPPWLHFSTYLKCAYLYPQSFVCMCIVLRYLSQCVYFLVISSSGSPLSMSSPSMQPFYSRWLDSIKMHHFLPCRCSSWVAKGISFPLSWLTKIIEGFSLSFEEFSLSYPFSTFLTNWFSCYSSHFLYRLHITYIHNSSIVFYIANGLYYYRRNLASPWRNGVEFGIILETNHIIMNFFWKWSQTNINYKGH